MRTSHKETKSPGNHLEMAVRDEEGDLKRGEVMEGLVSQVEEFLVCLDYSVVVQSPSHVRLFVTPWAAARQASLSLTISRSLPKFMSIASVMPSSHLILCTLFSFCPQSFPASRTSVSQLFTSDDQNTGASASASVFPVHIQGLSPLRLTGLISLLPKGVS